MKPWWKTATDPAVADTPDWRADLTWPFNTDSPVLDGLKASDHPLEVMLVDVTGLEWPDIEPLLPLARKTALERGMVPVIVVDLTEFGDLRQSGLAYDVLPNAAANAQLFRSGNWLGYLERRRLLLTEKWRPAAIVHLSGRAEGWQ